MFENKTSAHFLIAKDIFVYITCSWRMNIILSDIGKSIVYTIFFLTDHRPVSVYRLVVMNFIFSGLFWSRFSVVYQTENWVTRPRLSAGPALLMLGQQCAGCQVWHIDIYIFPPQGSASLEVADRSVCDLRRSRALLWEDGWPIDVIISPFFVSRGGRI